MAHDEVHAPVVSAVLLHDELQLLADVWILRTGCDRLADTVDLRVRAEPALSAHRHLVSALHFLLDGSLQGESAVEGALDGLVHGDNSGGFRHVRLREEVGVLLHRHEGHLYHVAALDGNIPFLVRDVRNGKESNRLGVDVERHVLFAHAHHARVHRVARVEPLAESLELLVKQGREARHR